MTDEQYMRLAIEEAKKAKSRGWTPLGVVIVKDDKVLVAGTSHVGESLDPTAHGESWCMREACQRLQTLDLWGALCIPPLRHARCVWDVRDGVDNIAGVLSLYNHFS